MEYTADLKSAAERIEGSTPSNGTKLPYALVAQLVEQQPFKLFVTRSIRVQGTIFNKPHRHNKPHSFTLPAKLIELMVPFIYRTI